MAVAAQGGRRAAKRSAADGNTTEVVTKRTGKRYSQD
jgi:hypothetical protein